MKRKHKTRKQLETIFERLYARAEAVIKKYSPCEVKIIGGKAQCLGCSVRMGNFFGDDTYAKKNTLCCDGCQFHTKKGCIAEKPLACKLWLCEYAAAKYPLVAIRLERIRQIAKGRDLYWPRGNKKMHLDTAEFGGPID